MSEDVLRELHERLQLARYILLPCRFDAASVFKEASLLLDRFVSHRELLGFGQWKALAIRNSNGLSASVGRESIADSASRSTEITSNCPVTMKVIEEVADPAQIRRARFMLLEPGAMIAPHRDADVALSATLNFCITYPIGCRFDIGVGVDGSGGVTVPFEAGRVFLLNVADRHVVFNHSDYLRLHIVVEGPLRMADGALLDLARESTDHRPRTDVRTELLRRFLAERRDGT